MHFLARRLFHSLFTLLGVSVFAFALMQWSPGNFVSDLELNPRVSSQTIADLRAQYGIDRSLSHRYAAWVGSLAHGDLGFSFAYNLPVGDLVVVRARNTLLLSVAAALFAWLLAVPAGICAAVRSGGWFDRLVTGSTSLLLAIPEITLALGLLLVAVRTGVLPAGGMSSARVADGSALPPLYDLASHMVLPVLVLVLAALPTLVRHVRASMLDALSSPHIQAARAHGLPQHRILLYAFRAAANPLISFAGLSVAALLSGSLVVEVITSWPGMGPLIVEAVLARDLYVVVAGVLLSALCLVAGNLLADVLLYAADPRIRMERG